MTTTKIETELQKATGVKPKRSEDRQAYLERLVLAVSNLDDFDALTQPARDWFRSRETEYEADQPLGDFENEEHTKEEANGKAADEGQQPDDDTGDARPAAGRRRDRPQSAAEKEDDMATKKKAAAPKSGGKAPAKKAAARKPASTKLGQGAPTLIKQIVLKNPEISTADLAAKLKAKGLKVSTLTVSSIRSGFRHSIKILQQAGHCKNVEV